MQSFGPAQKRTGLMIRSEGRVFLPRWVETGDLSVPTGRIGAAAAPPERAAALTYLHMFTVFRAAMESASDRRVACHLVLPTRRVPW